MSGYTPEPGERLAFDNGAWATWDGRLRKWDIYDAHGRHRGSRDSEEAAEAFGENLGRGQAPDE